MSTVKTRRATLSSPRNGLRRSLLAKAVKAPQTDEDRLFSFRTMFAYTGLYRIEGNRLTTKVDVGRGMKLGREQIRCVSFDCKMTSYSSRAHRHLQLTIQRWARSGGNWSGSGQSSRI